jgi:hypothetical protein
MVSAAAHVSAPNIEKHLAPRGSNEGHVQVVSTDLGNHTFEVIVTQNDVAGERIRPAIWPTAVLLEGNDLAFDIKAVASPNARSDLTLVIQT